VEALRRLQGTPAARGEIINIGNNQPITIRNLAQRVRELTHSPSAIETVPYEAAYAAGFEDMRQRRPALAKLERLTGFRPHRPLDDIIREVAEEQRCLGIDPWRDGEVVTTEAVE
jgi:UDP-glucose 4-epimerase